MKPIKHLSGGQCMRLALAVGFAETPDPDLLLLDEPTLNMDADAIRALGRVLNEFQGAIIVSTHDRWFFTHDVYVREIWFLWKGALNVVPIADRGSLSVEGSEAEVVEPDPDQVPQELTDAFKALADGKPFGLPPAAAPKAGKGGASF